MSTFASRRCDICRAEVRASILSHSQKVELPAGWAEIRIHTSMTLPSEVTEACGSCVGVLRAKLKEMEALSQ